MKRTAELKKEMGYEGDPSLIDIHRLKDRKDGGDLTEDNVALKEPVSHMKHHGTYRERADLLEEIKSLVDDRKQLLRLSIKAQNQLMAFERNVDHLNQTTVEFLEGMLTGLQSQVKVVEKDLTRAVKEYAKVDEFTAVVLSVPGCGPIITANMLAYIDLEKARHASSLWAYCGYDKPSHERYKKGESGGGNKTLRTALHVWSSCQLKAKTKYSEIYYQVKARLEVSNRLVKTRNTKGELVEIPWKDAKPSHRHGAALRKMIKHFLADYWKVGREMRGLPTDPVYAEAILKGNHKTIAPEERGWKY